MAADTQRKSYQITINNPNKYDLSHREIETIWHKIIGEFRLSL